MEQKGGIKGGLFCFFVNLAPLEVGRAVVFFYSCFVFVFVFGGKNGEKAVKIT